MGTSTIETVIYVIIIICVILAVALAGVIAYFYMKDNNNKKLS